MATRIIPTVQDGGPFFLQTDLDGETYELSFYFNEREGFWYFDLLDANSNRIRSGVKCVVNFPLLRLVTAESRPPGELLVLDATLPAEDPGIDDLGDTIVFAYEEAATLPA